VLKSELNTICLNDNKMNITNTEIKMNITNTEIKGLFVIEPNVYKDDRGYFMETYNKHLNDTLGIEEWIQDNESMSNKFTVRGLHYQRSIYSQAKLVRVVQGSVIDTVVDIRAESETYGKSFSILLTGDNKKQLFVPRGFAHGFSTLANNTIFNYKCDDFYNAESECGINPFDPDLNIDWKIKGKEVIMSEKDKLWPNFCDIEKEYIY